MLHPLRILKPVSETNESIAALPSHSLHSPDIPVDATPYVVSVARRYQNRGLNLAQLVAAGEEGWRRAQRHYGTATEQFDRWGSRWVQEEILKALDAPLPDKESIE